LHGQLVLGARKGGGGGGRKGEIREKEREREREEKEERRGNDKKKSKFGCLSGGRHETCISKVFRTNRRLGIT
jgi:hypothetical protein